MKRGFAIIASLFLTVICAAAQPLWYHDPWETMTSMLPEIDTSRTKADTIVVSPSMVSDVRTYALEDVGEEYYSAILKVERERLSDNSYYVLKNYIFPLTLSKEILPDIKFEIDWYYSFPRDGVYQIYESTDKWFYRVSNDTIYTTFEPVEGNTCPQYTPEDIEFRFVGPNLAKIESRSRSHYTIVQYFDRNDRESWGNWMHSGATEWQNTTTGNNSYKTPLFDRFTIPRAKFDSIKIETVKLQTKTLIDDAQTLKADPEIGDYYSRVMENLKGRLKPNFADAKNFDEMYVMPEFSWTESEIIFIFKDGSRKTYTHVVWSSLCVL